MKQYVATSTIPPFRRKADRGRYFSETQKTQVYDAIVDAGPEGITRPDIAAKVGLRADRISFYLSELRRNGFISVKGDPTTVSATMNADEAAFAAMLGLENALVARVREMTAAKKTPPPEMDKSFVKYTMLKERALAQPAAGSSATQVTAQKNEATVALRMALIELVKLVF